MTENFVEMVKDGVYLVVHPSTVASHQRAGWKVSKDSVPAPKPLKADKAEDKPSSEKSDKEEDKTSSKTEPK